MAATRVDVDRVTASAIYHRAACAGGLWATTVAWGRNVEDGEATHAVLAETHVSLADRHIVFGRAEVVEKSSHDLELHGDDESFNVGSFKSATRDSSRPQRLARRASVAAFLFGVGARGLASTYGGRAPLGPRSSLSFGRRRWHNECCFRP